MAGLGLAVCYVAFRLLGPGGIPMVVEKRDRIRALQQQNENLRQDIEQKREHIRAMAVDKSAQEEAIRGELKRVRKKETVFLLQ